MELEQQAEGGMGEGDRRRLKTNRRTKRRKKKKKKRRRKEEEEVEPIGRWQLADGKDGAT